MPPAAHLVGSYSGNIWSCSLAEYSARRNFPDRGPTALRANQENQVIFVKILLRYPLRTLNNRRVRLWNNGVAACRPFLDFGPAIKRILGHPQGMMYGKVGTTELQALEYSDRCIRSNWLPGATWRRQAQRLFIDSGVFPAERDEFEFFLNTYKKSIQKLDAICLWQDRGTFLQEYESAIAGHLCPLAYQIDSAVFSPFHIYEYLKNVKLLVVSPFIKSMRAQLDKLPDVFGKYSCASSLKDMRERCEFVRCPFFSYLEKSPFSSWREGLLKMTDEILQHQFDLALIGAGAWSVPLLANLKSAGRKGLHTGGSTQLFFGIRGKRWEQKGYNYFNQYWISPLPEDTPKDYKIKEDGCYW